MAISIPMYNTQHEYSGKKKITKQNQLNVVFEICEELYSIRDEQIRNEDIPYVMC